MEVTEMVTMFKPAHYGSMVNGHFVEQEHTLFPSVRMERLAEVDGLIQKLKANRRGRIIFHHFFDDPCNNKAFTIRADNIAGWRRINLDNLVAVLNPVGSIELHDGKTGKFLFNMGGDPCPEWRD